MLKSLHHNDPDQRNQVHNVIYVMPKEDREVFKTFKIDRPTNIVEADSTAEVFKILKSFGGRISAIVTSLKLPDMEGIDFLRQLKRNLSWNYIPTIVITNDINEKNLVESMNAGAFYYLEKPFGELVFTSVMNKALKDFTTYVFYLSKAQNVQISRLITQGQFKLRTFKEGYEVADWLASLCMGKSRDDIVVGFIELLINAIEHGNLEVGYDEKSSLMKEGNYLDRLVERLELPQYKNKFVLVDFERNSEELTVTITDQGKGFEYGKYLVMDKKRMFHSHGKGIIMASNLYFDHLKYSEMGNSVTIKVLLNKN
jgi:response regulator RpfG family c-di-GMP phosphodiesterase